MRTTILAVGYAAPGYGWGRVLQSLLRPLATSYDVVLFERSGTGGPAWGWETVANAPASDRLGLERLPHVVKAVRPALVLVVCEIWEASQYVQLLQQAAADIPTVAYCPVDGPLQIGPWLEPLAGLAALSVYTRAAAREVRQCFAGLEAGGSRAALPDIDVIPHGVDGELFYPLDARRPGLSRALARAALFPDRPELSDAFIVLNGNRNQPRKRLDLTLRGFRTFALGKPENVLIYLHSGVIDQGVNVLGLANGDRDLERRLLRRSYSKDHPVVSDRELNLIYNACDVGVNTSTAEAWGLVSFEHAATRAAQIVPGHASLRELWGDAALTLCAAIEVTDPTPVEQRAVRPDDLANGLEHLYADQDLLARLSDAAYRRATAPGLSWDAVAAQFTSLFRRVLDAPGRGTAIRQPTGARQTAFPASGSSGAPMLSEPRL